MPCQGRVACGKFGGAERAEANVAGCGSSTTTALINNDFTLNPTSGGRGYRLKIEKKYNGAMKLNNRRFMQHSG